MLPHLPVKCECLLETMIDFNNPFTVAFWNELRKKLLLCHITWDLSPHWLCRKVMRSWASAFSDCSEWCASWSCSPAVKVFELSSGRSSNLSRLTFNVVCTIQLLFAAGFLFVCYQFNNEADSECLVLETMIINYFSCTVPTYHVMTKICIVCVSFRFP